MTILTPVAEEPKDVVAHFAGASRGQAISCGRSPSKERLD